MAQVTGRCSGLLYQRRVLLRHGIQLDHGLVDLRDVVVFGDIDRRATVRGLCETLAPGCLLTDVTSVTDAVLLALATHVDIVLVDAGLAEGLLHSLIQHVRRTSPRAKVSVFGIDEGVTAVGKDRSQVEVLSWERLEQTLMELLQVRVPPFPDLRQ